MPELPSWLPVTYDEWCEDDRFAPPHEVKVWGLWLIGNQTPLSWLAFLPPAQEGRKAALRARTYDEALRTWEGV